MEDYRIGIVGLGSIGGSIATHLIEAGRNVHGHDVEPDPRSRLADAGGTIHDSPSAVVKTCDVVFTSLPTTAAVREVFYGDNGVLEAAEQTQDDTVVFECSTIDPQLLYEIEADLPESGIVLFGAPVSGGASGAREGNLTLMIGGDEAAVDEDVREVLELVSNTRHFVGDVAAGHVTKAVNNAMAFGNTLLAMEAMALGARFGVDAGALYEVIDNGSGGSNQFAKRMPRVFDRDFDQGFTIDYAVKDLAIASDMAAATEQPLFVTNLVLELYRFAQRQGYGHEDPSAVLKLFEADDHRIETDRTIDDEFTGY